ncbi:MFS transporter [Mycobacterium sp.]|jgi:predicted MFS family arabinose efflux permease|uniref:MFS transporter n=1 Tax=Mycobacterium sp. TaxID=1785 RepID=UPI002BF98B3F|nr:MFS transporter [Mycobacterium sp.]HTH85484.1 MFS transporter [Mycobacterium sp.]
MTVVSRTRPAHTWTPHVTVQLSVLAAAAFVYVTAEMVPVGALAAIAADLRVSEALVGTLLASYALVAALATVPLVRFTARWPRRTTLLLTLVCLTVSQLISALAPNFTMLASGRVLCALTHGLMWSVIAPIGARLVPATHAGRATAAVYVGTSLALVAGNPLTAAMSELWGWRLAVVLVSVAAAAVTVAAWAVLPRMTMPRDEATTVRRSVRHHRNSRLITLTALTLIGVTGHFISYTFIVVIIRDVVGVHGPRLAWLLAAFGIAGLISMAAMARPLDRWPQASVVGCLAALALTFAVLTSLAFDHSAGLVVLIVGVAAIVLWGAASTALPPMLQAVAMRTAPDDPDGASGVYVSGFQVGIMAGSLSGGLLYERAGLAFMIAASTALVMVALTAVTATRGLFDVPQAICRK